MGGDDGIPIEGMRPPGSNGIGGAEVGGGSDEGERFDGGSEGFEGGPERTGGGGADGSRMGGARPEPGGGGVAARGEELRRAGATEPPAGVIGGARIDVGAGGCVGTFGAGMTPGISERGGGPESLPGRTEVAHRMQPSAVFGSYRIP
jgi:hypothetical protein